MRARLFFLIARMQAGRLMSYRADFWINAFGSFSVQMVITYFLWKAVFDATGGAALGSYSFQGMMLYYVLINLLGKLIRGPEIGGMFSEEIYDGSLTRYLIYPTQYFPYKYAQRLGDLIPGLIQLLLLSLLYLFVFGMPADVAITPMSIAMTIPIVMLAHLLNFCISAPIELVAFWAENVWSLNVMLRLTATFLGGGLFPLTLFPEAFQRFVFFLPFQYIFAFPVNVLLGKVGAGEWALGLLVCVVWIGICSVITSAVWQRGTAQFTGVGM